MKSPEAYRIPRSIVAIAATGTVALSAYSLGDHPTAQALSFIKCGSVELDIHSVDSIGGNALVNAIQGFAVNQYIESVSQPDSGDLYMLQNAVATEIRQDVAVGSIPLPAKDQDTFNVCVSPGNPNYTSVDFVRQI